MKIKITFSEKFLLSIFNVMQELGKMGDSRVIGFPRTMKDALCHDAFIIRRNEEREKARRDFHKLIYKLKNGGYIKKLKVKDKSAIILTPKGKEKIFTIKLKMLDKKIRKDKKWQMVLFDIPEKKRKDRDLFRDGLRYLGYKQLQKSIWVCPYDTIKETKELIKRYKLDSFVDLILVNRVKLG